MISPADPDESPRGDAPHISQLTELLTTGVGVRSVALTVLMLLGVLYTLYFAKPVVLPIVLAIILSLLLTPTVRFLRAKLRCPSALGAAIVLMGVLGSVAAVGLVVVEPASAWMQTIPEKIPELKARLKLLQRPFETVREASEQVNQLTDLGASQQTPVVKMLTSDAPTAFLMSQTPAFLANLVVMFILLYFMLASGNLFLRKLVHMIPSFDDKRRTVEIAHEIQERISTYLRTVTIINIALGIAIGAAAFFVGLQNYVFWGVLAFGLNYVPYLGAFVGVVATFVVGLLTFESTAYAFVMPAIYITINTIEGNFLTPLIVGRILTLNPVVIFIALMFWGWIWGIAGALLAVPLLAIFKIVCDHLKPLQPIGEFVGGAPEATPAT